MSSNEIDPELHLQEMALLQRRREFAINTAMKSLGGNPTLDALLEASEQIENFLIQGETTKEDPTVESNALDTE